MSFDLPPELAELQATRPQAGPGQGRAPGPRDRHDARRTRRTSSSSSARRGLLGLVHPRGVRRVRRRDPRPHDRDRRGRQVLQHRRAHAAAHPPADRAGADRRRARSRSSSTCAASRPASMRAGFGLSEPQAGSDVVGMRTKAVARRRRLGAHRHEVLDVGRRAGRLVLRVRQDRPGRLAQARRHLVLHRRARVAGRVGRPHRRQDGRAGRRHRRAVLDDVRVPGRERRRRDRRVPARDARAQLDAADRRRARHRSRRGRADVRGRVREAARRVRQDDRRHAGHPVEDRRARDRDRGRAPAHLPRRA